MPKEKQKKKKDRDQWEDSVVLAKEGEGGKVQQGGVLWARAPGSAIVRSERLFGESSKKITLVEVNTNRKLVRSCGGGQRGEKAGYGREGGWSKRGRKRISRLGKKKGSTSVPVGKKGAFLAGRKSDGGEKRQFFGKNEWTGR